MPGARTFFTWSTQASALPLTIVDGQGARFRTDDGADWIDFGSLVWNANLGHGHRGMIDAVATAAARGLLAMPASMFPDKIRAADALLSVAPAGLSDGKVFICLSGAEANENAVKMAFQVTGRPTIVYRSRSYHGATLGMLSMSGDPRRAGFPSLPRTLAWDDPYSATPAPGDLEEFLNEQRPASVAAVILEGVVGANGVIVPPPGYFRRIRELCDRFGCLFIADEVLSGFGRTGRWFAVDHDGVSPDLLTCAKGLTAGYAPGGAVVTSAKVAAHFDDHVLSCGLTGYAHPLTCAAIAAAVDAYREGDLLTHAARQGRRLAAGLAHLAQHHASVRSVRGLGLLWAFDVHEPDGNTLAGSAVMQRLAASLRRLHLHVHKRDHMIFLAPPLVIDDAEMDDGLERLRLALADAGVA